METSARTRPSPEALVLCAAIVLACISPDVVGGVGVGLLDVRPVDLALLIVAVLGARAAWSRRDLAHGLARHPVVVAALVLLVTVVLATLAGPALTDGYPFSEKLVSAAKFVELGLLVVLVPLLVRTDADRRAVVGTLLATAVAAAIVGILQILGWIPNADNVGAGRRMPSFLGYHDFAVLCAIALGIAMTALALLERPRRGVVAAGLFAGITGVVIGASMAVVIAVLAGTALVLGVAARRGALRRGRAIAIGASAAAVVLGTAAMRSGDLHDFVSFLGSSTEGRSGTVDTYSQRVLLSYIGLRIFLDHPLTGVGWQASELPQSFEPYLDDARRRFPDLADESFPSAEHPWGVQNAYVQAGSDLGLIGMLAIAGVVAAAILLSFRRLGRGPPARALPVSLGVAFAVIVCAVEWAALGLVAGSPVSALIWLTLGAAVALRALDQAEEG